MILSDRSIRSHIENGTIGVTPTPDEEQIQPASLDIRIAQKTYNMHTDTVVDDEARVRIKPGEPYLCSTQETISLPNNIAAQLAGRSSVGRQGLIIHKTAGWIDPGFEGELTLEVYNFSDETVEFEPGDRVGQLVFFRLDSPSQGYDGRYQGQRGVTKSEGVQ